MPSSSAGRFPTSWCSPGAWFALFLLAAGAAHAHPIHLSYAEVTHNREAKTLEVAIRVYPDDLLEVTGRDAGRALSYEQTPAAELAAAIARTTRRSFAVRDGQGKPIEAKWIGWEFDQEQGSEQRVWIYLEFPVPEGIQDVRIRHALLADLYRDQVNSVHLRDGERRLTLVFFPGDPEKPIVFKTRRSDAVTN